MKICIPTTGNDGLDDSVGEHFGRVPTYTIIDLETSQVKIIANTSHHMNGSGYPPEMMQQEGVDIMICQGLGRRAINMFNEYGIEVYIGATGAVRDAVDDFKKGLLKKATSDDACGRHAFRDQHHQDHH